MLPATQPGHNLKAYLRQWALAPAGCIERTTALHASVSCWVAIQLLVLLPSQELQSRRASAQQRPDIPPKQLGNVSHHTRHLLHAHKMVNMLSLRHADL